MIIRVFPRRTNVTPVDDLTYIGYPTLFAAADEIRISVTFTWDIPEAERMAEAWRQVAPVTIGGPAYNQPGGEFTPGLYLREGYTITSRGCPNRCWFCAVWKRERGEIRELEIQPGWNVFDDNLLACSESHIRAVFAMLKLQPRRPEFTGGLEAALLLPWHVELLRSVKPRRLYFAYDTPDDYEPLREAARLLWAGGFTPTSHVVSAYCLIGYPRDSFEAAEARLKQVIELGITPFAMLWRDKKGKYDRRWREFQRRWARPAIIYGGSNEKNVLDLPGTWA